MNQTNHAGSILNDLVRRNSGMPLPRPQRDFFERGFGCPLDTIRVHVDRGAAEALEAEAFAVGRHIVLREEPSDWDAPSTRYLLGHEIAHCLQQSTVPDGAPIVGVGGADDLLEREAHCAATRLLVGSRAGPVSRETDAIVRRKSSVVPSTVMLRVVQEPTPLTPYEANVQGQGQMKFQNDPTAPADWIKLSGSASLTGDPTDKLEGFTLGWINIEWEETNYGIYRGLSASHGSFLLKRDTAPARIAAQCRDTFNPQSILVDQSARGLDHQTVLPGTVVPAKSASPFLLPLRCEFKDAPGDTYVLQAKNDVTKQMNYLYEVEINMRFCTVLTLQWPDKHFEHLKHVFWKMHWHYFFKPPAKAGDPWVKQADVAVQQSSRVGDVQYGPPTDRWVKMVLDAANAPNCIQLAGSQSQNPVVIPPRSDWYDFPSERYVRKF